MSVINLFKGDGTRTAEVVKQIETMLAAAKRGEITDLCYVAICDKEYEVGRTTSIIDAIGLASLMHFRFLRQMEI